MTKTITGNPQSIQNLATKPATWLLAMSNTATADIPGITQAGIPGMIHLTPVLDGELVATGEVRSLPNVAETPKGVPTPALITRAVHLLHPFAQTELLDLGLRVQPQGEDISVHHFGIVPSGSIAEGAQIDAKVVFEKGVAFGREYTPEGAYVILAESVPSGTTTATATALALGYDAREKFSSSFRDVPNSIRQETINAALARMQGVEDIWEKLGQVSDNMLLFNAGFVLGVAGRFPVVLAGGTQMAAVLLVADAMLRQSDAGKGLLPPKDVYLATTKWVAEDPHSDIAGLLGMLSFPIDAVYADFDFALSEHPALKLYDEGEAKEGVGAGGALVYGMINGLYKAAITRQVEGFSG